uniref:uncharacterized protein LOC122601043 n=1 Tax=Erigeron canadensis TaxID=72917 RepID=UPI001CB9B699|nr:uncharacterized protein LOC122601043 [Erigeron canadensis]
MGEAAERFRSTTSSRFTKEIREGSHMEADELWTLVADGMRETAKEVLGVTRGIGRQRRVGRESWWISEEVQSKVATKLRCFKDLVKSRQNGTNEDWSLARQRYYEAKKEAKRTVAIAKERAYEELYKKLDSKEGENEIFRIAKARERRRRDLGDVIFIKDESGRSIVKEGDIRKRWEEYFANLFNGRRSGRIEGGEVSTAHPNTRYDDDDAMRISQEEVRIALKKMGRNKAVGPDQILVEAWRCLGDVGISLLTSLFNKIWTSAKMPEEWRFSEEKVIERRLRRVTKVAENQFGFMPGRSTMEAIHITRSLMEKYRERQKALHYAFLDLDKAYDSVPRELI